MFAIELTDSFPSMPAFTSNPSMLTLDNLGTYYPALYYGFFCEPFYQVAYIVGVTIFGAGECV